MSVVTVEMVRNEINIRRQKIADGVSLESKERMEREVKEFEEQLKVKLAEQQRETEQEAKVLAITLPHDFNKVFDDTRANEIIIELIQQHNRQAYADHNEEISILVNGHKEELRAAADREIKLQQENNELQKEIKAGTEEIFRLIERIKKEESNGTEQALQRKDSDSKRDAAVRELEGARTEISQLKEQLANITVSKPIAVGVVNNTDKLAKLVKETLAEKANRAMKQAAARGLIPELTPLNVEVPTIPTIQEVPQQGATFPTIGVESNQLPASETIADVSSFRPQETETDIPGQSNGTAGGTVVSEPTLEAAFERIRELEKQVFGKAVE